MSQVFLFGEPMVMLTARQQGTLEEATDFARALAGAEANVAIGLCRLGYTVSYFTRLGNDTLGSYIFNKLKKEGVDAVVSYDCERPTGMQFKSNSPGDDPTVCYFRKNSAASAISRQNLQQIDLADASHVHITGITAALSPSCLDATEYLMAAARQRGIPVSFDPNLRPILWRSQDEMVRTINRLAAQSTLFLPGISEARLLCGCDSPTSIAAYYRSRGVETVIIKLGSDGAYYESPHEYFHLGGYTPAQVLDTVGAGDGFAVGIISGLLDKLPAKEMVARANAIGAIQVSSSGDNDGLPTRSSLAAFIERSCHDEATACH